MVPNVKHSTQISDTLEMIPNFAQNHNVKQLLVDRRPKSTCLQQEVGYETLPRTSEERCMNSIDQVS